MRAPKKRGKPPYFGKNMKSSAISLPEEAWALFDLLATEKGIPRNEIIRQVLLEKINDTTVSGTPPGNSTPVHDVQIVVHTHVRGASDVQRLLAALRGRGTGERIDLEVDERDTGQSGGSYVVKRRTPVAERRTPVAKRARR